MKQLDAKDMLNIWERSLNQSCLDRALIMLVATHPEFSSDEIIHMNIGQRDKYLLQLRERLFGSILLNTAVCPECSEQIEWQNNVKDFLASPLDDEISERTYEVDAAGYQIKFRLPNSLDIAAVVNSEAVDDPERQLLSQCVIDTNSSTNEFDVNMLSDEVLKEAAKKIELLDPQAVVSVDLNCPACANKWDVIFDISSFLWTELNEWAGRTLILIDTLAKAYGWTEKEILNLSPVRRQLYFGMLKA